MHFVLVKLPRSSRSRRNTLSSYTCSTFIQLWGLLRPIPHNCLVSRAQSKWKKKYIMRKWCCWMCLKIAPGVCCWWSMRARRLFPLYNDDEKKLPAMPAWWEAAVYRLSRLPAWPVFVGGAGSSVESTKSERRSFQGRSIYLFFFSIFSSFHFWIEESDASTPATPRPQRSPLQQYRHSLSLFLSLALL
jgi:hypothetical protein